VLSDYLGQIALPKPAALGLFHDDYVLSHSLVEPWTTLPAIILVIGMIAGALSLRRRTPALSMGVLWYFGAQILESGPIPLEIYFEHRNYFPMAGLLIGVGIEAVGALERVAVLRRHTRYGVFFAASWLVMLSGITYAEARLWAEPYAQAGAWAKARPHSMRAQAHWAGILADMRFTEGAEDVYDSLTPRDPGYRLAAIATNCLRSGTRFREGYDDVLARMRTMKFSRTVIGALERLAGSAEAGRCLEASRLFFEPTVAALLDNAHFASRRFHLRVLQGRYRIAIGRYRDARQDFLAALSLRKDVEVAMLVVKASYLAGDQAQAGVDLDQARRINAGIGVASWTYGQDIEDWAAGVAAMPSARQTGETDDAGDVGRGADARRGGPAQGKDGDAAR
jgi:hypothetical protein